MGTDRKQAWTGRLVTYGLVFVLAFGVVQEVEAWPVTPLRLFSEIRTGESIVLELVAVEPNGNRAVVRPYGEVAATTRLKYRELLQLDLGDQRTKVRAWLAAVVGFRLVQRPWWHLADRPTELFDPVAVVGWRRQRWRYPCRAVGLHRTTPSLPPNPTTPRESDRKRRCLWEIR